MRRLLVSLAALLVALTLAVPIGGIAMAQTTESVTNVALPAGTTTFPAASHGWSLPTPGTILSQIDATTCPAGATLTMAVQRSADGGTTWQDDVAYTIAGGPYTNKQGGSTWNNSTDWAGGNLRVLVTTDTACTVKSVSVQIS